MLWIRMGAAVKAGGVGAEKDHGDPRREALSYIIRLLCQMRQKFFIGYAGPSRFAQDGSTGVIVAGRDCRHVLAHPERPAAEF